ncbi:MAG: Lrp/AsnC family transcriptional regulator [Candidatus Thermoplasmatota archaeon]|nr:Lrp/AsnC family transcriptional regulator [Candidatus Thermoplasmatota archaeon]
MISKIDKRMIELLQEDARMPISQISKEVGLSENGVRYRLEKLEKDGIIKQYAVLVNPTKIGKKVKAIFKIQLDHTEIQQTIKKIKEFDELISVYQTSGHYLITAIGLFESNEQLSNFINNTLLVKCNIRDYCIDIVIKECKNSIYQI